VPAEFDDEKRALFNLSCTDPAAAIPTLVEWVERFPTVPTVKSWLVNGYRALGRTAEADALGERMLRDHPNYLFARLYWAGRMMDAGWLDKVPIALAPFDLKEMYPHRSQFHVSEALSFWAVMARYRCLIGDLGAAADHLWDMQQLAPDHPDTRAIEQMLATATAAALQRLADPPARVRDPQRPFRHGSHTPKKDRNRKGRRR